MESPHSEIHEIIDCDSLSVRDQRTVIFYLLYIFESFDEQATFEEVVKNFCHGFSCTIDSNKSIYKKTNGIILCYKELDEVIKPFLHNWKFNRIGTCTKIILRIALWELTYSSLDISVVINEAIELAKCFAETDAHKFINGLLDEWTKIHQLNRRSLEVPVYRAQNNI